MDDPSNGLHVLATANPGCTGGQAGGFAMDGSGIGSALQCNRRGDGFGNGANGNVVDEVTGFGLSGQFSSRSEEHTSELQSLMRISYAVFCLKKKTQQYNEAQ